MTISPAPVRPADDATVPAAVGSPTPFDADAAWILDPQVALRPEPFGALAYHFGTRRLSFLKSRTLLAVVEGLEHAPSARDACRWAGVPPEDEATYERALATLAGTGMIRRRPGPSLTP